LRRCRWVGLPRRIPFVGRTPAAPGPDGPVVRPTTVGLRPGWFIGSPYWMPDQQEQYRGQTKRLPSPVCSSQRPTASRIGQAPPTRGDQRGRLLTVPLATHRELLAGGWPKCCARP
jgi:hypothetical protein